MLRVLAILTVLLASLPVHGRCEGSNASRDQKNAQAIEGKSPELSSVTIVNSVENHAPKGQSDETENHPKSYLRRLFSPENLPNILLFAVGFAGIVVAVLTLRKIERQTKAGEVAAEAALANTKALIAAERAWIVVTAKCSSPNEFLFTATNVGRTPAKVISIYGNKIVINRGEELPLPFQENMEESLISTPPCFLPPTSSCPAFSFNLEQLFAGNPNVMRLITIALQEIYFYGKIRYFDTLEDPAKSIHETTWLLWVPPVEGALPIPDPRHPECNGYK
jgi:hypothetical protein